MYQPTSRPKTLFHQVKAQVGRFAAYCRLGKYAQQHGQPAQARGLKRQANATLDDARQLARRLTPAQFHKLSSPIQEALLKGTVPPVKRRRTRKLLQAQPARIVYKQVYKKADTKHWQQQLQRATRQTREASEKALMCHAEHQRSQRHIAQLTQQLQQAQQHVVDLAETKVQIQRAQQQLVNLQQVERQKTALTQETEDLQRQLRQSRTRHDQQEAQLRRQLEDIQQAQVIAQGTLTRAENRWRSAQRQAETCEQKLESHVADIAAHEQKAQRCADQLKATRTSLTQAEKWWRSAQRQAKTCKQEFQDHLANIAARDRKVQHCSHQLKAARDQLFDLETQREGLRTSLEASRKQTQKSKARNKELQRRLYNSDQLLAESEQQDNQQQIRLIPDNPELRHVLRMALEYQARHPGDPGTGRAMLEETQPLGRWMSSAEPGLRGQALALLSYNDFVRDPSLRELVTNGL